MVELPSKDINVSIALIPLPKYTFGKLILVFLHVSFVSWKAVADARQPRRLGEFEHGRRPWQFRLSTYPIELHNGVVNLNRPTQVRLSKEEVLGQYSVSVGFTEVACDKCEIVQVQIRPRRILELKNWVRELLSHRTTMGAIIVAAKLFRSCPLTFHWHDYSPFSLCLLRRNNPRGVSSVNVGDPAKEPRELAGGEHKALPFDAGGKAIGH